jgi:integrase
LKHNLVDKPELLSCSKIGEAKHRTYTPSELEKMLNIIQHIDFNRFIRQAYYTGARNGEILSISSDNVLVGSIVVFGKTGRRYVKLNSQVQKIINDLELYTKR